MTEKAVRPIVVAHRGGCALGPENTLAAFDLGLQAGADAIELDVHLSADGEVVVCHDATLDRTTDTSGPIARRTAAELARVDAGFRFSPDGRTHPFRGRGIGVPTLDEVLRRYPQVPCIVEMKVDEAAMGRRLAEVVARAGATGRVCAAGDGLACLAAARAALPGLASSAGRLEVRNALYRSWIGWPIRGAAFQRFQIPERAGLHRVVSPRFIRRAHEAGLTVEVWTVDDAADMARLLGWGVDGLITNRPDVAVRVKTAVLDAGRPTGMSV